MRHDFADQLILVDRLSFDRHKIDYISLNADQLRAEKSPLGFVRISGAYMDPPRMQELSSMGNGKETRTYIRPVDE